MAETPPPRRVALVTGGSGAIGAACVERLRADGLVAVAGWRSTAPASTDGPHVQFDVTDAGAVEGAVAEVEDRFGPIHVVVANAGFAHLDLALRASAESFRSVVDTNLTGAFLTARAALGPM
ncbi:MAG TPA: SDR family NAD(P)-dependent oxidoreductase, partial [Acidimicrobiales bacterium]